MKIFISYASEDLEEFRVPEIAKYLEAKEEIDRVFYWDRDNKSNQTIVKYMEENIDNSEIFLAISSANSLESNPVQKETEFAIYQDKQITPIFRDFKYVRDFIRTYRGLQFQDEDFGNFLEDLYDLISGQNYETSMVNQEECLTQELYDKFKGMIYKLFDMERDYSYNFARLLLRSDKMQDLFGIEIRDKDYLDDQDVGFMDGLYWLIPNSRTLRYRNKRGDKVLTRNTLINMEQDEIIEKLDPFLTEIKNFVKMESGYNLV